MQPRRPRAFTLVELMVALALGLIIIGMVTYTLTGAAKAITITNANVGLHDRARGIMMRMTQELESVHPGGAITFTSAPPRSLRFLTTAPTLDMNYDGASELSHDLMWVEYSWDETNRRLLRAYEYNASVSPGALATQIYDLDMPSSFEGSRIIRTARLKP
ncbi:MAG: prepilin-type N-terminal cleavage/methylation domain-containing protein [Planctomycetota bacterium]